MISSIKEKDIWKIQKIAHRTWPPTFKGILSDAQLYYMLDMMYSSNSLKHQISNNVQFDVYENQDNIMGFVGYEKQLYRSKEVLKIHKLYVDPTYQKKSIGKSLVLHTISFAKRNSLTSLVLNVNRFNAAVSFYQYMGFKIIDREDIDIGNGYLMEDYVMSFEI
jgi:N-acetylglutamate synthase-like GNAT family acetyltransferase